MRTARSRRPALAAAACMVVAVTASCSSMQSTEEDGALRFIAEGWNIAFPASAELTAYSSSEVDFQGGRDDVRVVAMDGADRTGFWDGSAFTVPAADASRGEATPAAIAESAGATLDPAALDAMLCREPLEQDQDTLFVCRDDEGGDYVLFEQIF